MTGVSGFASWDREPATQPQLTVADEAVADLAVDLSRQVARTPGQLVAEPAAVWERTDRPVATGVQVERRDPTATRPMSVAVGR